MIKIDPRSSTPIYEQIELGIKELIMKGALKNGEKLPSVREMAGILSINPNTISKAYGELEKDRIIETLRGKGTFVRENIEGKIDKYKMEEIKNELKKIILQASYCGMSKDQFIEIAQSIFSHLGGNKND